MVLQTLYSLGGFRSRVLLYCIFWRFAILVGAGGAIHAAEDNGDKACDGCDGAQEGHLRQREHSNQVFRVCCGLECGPFVRREEADVKRKVCHPTYGYPQHAVAAVLQTSHGHGKGEAHENALDDG